MTRRVPIRDIAHLRFALPADHRWTDRLCWIPVGITELHLACRYYPLAVRFEDATPRLGLLVDQACLVHPLLDAAGAWRGAYRPIGLRCYPFSAQQLEGDPLSDILVDPQSEYLSASAGAPLTDGRGAASPAMVELHQLFALLHRTELALAPALDHLLVAGLLAPLEGVTAGEAPPMSVINPARVSQLDSAALAAMARHAFHSVDVAVAGAFSLQCLRPGLRPKAAPPSRGQATPEVDLIALDDLSMALDDGELIPLSLLDAVSTERPVEPA